MIRKISMDSGLALDQEALNRNFEDAEERIIRLEMAMKAHAVASRNSSVHAILQGETIRVLDGSHPSLHLLSIHAAVGDSVKLPTDITITQITQAARSTIAKIQFKAGEHAGKIQIANIEDDIMIDECDEIEIEQTGMRRVVVFIAVREVQ